LGKNPPPTAQKIKKNQAWINPWLLLWICNCLALVPPFTSINVRTNAAEPGEIKEKPVIAVKLSTIIR